VQKSNTLKSFTLALRWIFNHREPKRPERQCGACSTPALSLKFVEKRNTVARLSEKIPSLRPDLIISLFQVDRRTSGKTTFV
jgi:hypothetical protein